jgi:hypothetical protein
LVFACHDQVFGLSKLNNSPQSRAEMVGLLAQLESEIAGLDLPFHAQLTLGGIRGLVANHLGSLEEASLIYRNVVLLWQSRPLILADQRDRYLLTVVNFLNTMYQEQNDAHFQSAIHMVRSGFELKGSMRRFVDIMCGNLELLHLMNAGRYEEAEQVVPRMAVIVKEQPEYLRPAHIITYSYNVAVLLFVSGRFRAMIEWLNRILDFPGQDIRADLRDAAQMLALIAHFELGNHDLLEYLIAAAQRKYNQHKDHFQLPRLVASHLRAAVLATKAQERASAIAQLAERYQSLPPEVAASEHGHSEVGIWLQKRMGAPQP